MFDTFKGHDKFVVETCEYEGERVGQMKDGIMGNVGFEIACPRGRRRQKS